MIMLVSLIAQVYAADDKAIIVKGAQQSDFQHDTELAYKELTQSRNLTPGDVQYLDGNTTAPGVDAAANKTSLQDAITNWAKNNCKTGGKLTIFTSSHGRDNGTPGDTTDDYLEIGPDRVTGQELKAWINQLKATPGVNVSEVIIVIEACHSGSFIDDLSAPNTTVITSAEPCEPSYGVECQGSVFPQPFWKAITNNDTIPEAFRKAYDSVTKRPMQVQNPQYPLYDDNGDGVGHRAPLPNGGDGSRTKELKIGVDISTNARPHIEDKTLDQSVAPGTSMVLTVTATDDEMLTRVYGRVFAPDFVFCDPCDEGCVWDPETIEFMPVSETQWQCDYTFDLVGDYYIMLLAEDSQSSCSYEEWISITSKEVPPPIGPDVAVTDVTPSKTVVRQGSTVNIDVTVAAEGEWGLTGDVTVYADTTYVGAIRYYYLSGGASTTLTSTWDTTGFAEGEYTISAYAWPFPDETDTADNTFVDGIVTVTVTIYELNISSTAGGSVTTPGEETFTCGAGTVVDLVATPDAGYRFVEWTGDVDTIADVEDATTTIAMEGNYEITANFEEECGFATAADLGALGLVSVGLLAAWARKRRGRGPGCT